jgi:cell division protein FtsI/penicillin-binding protein 2
MHVKKTKDMATTIKTSSKNYFNKIQKYLNNKRVFFTPSLNLGVYVLTIFDLNQDQTNSLISKMTKHFHLTMQQEPLALAA